MSVIHFYCPIAVQPKQSMRMRVVGGRPMSYQSPKVVNNAKELAKFFRLHAPSKPWTGPVLLEVIFYIKHPKSAPKKNRPFAHDRKPDRGNLLKQVEDVLEACGFVESDSQFYGGEVRKVWADDAGLSVHMEQ